MSELNSVWRAWVLLKGLGCLAILAVCGVGLGLAGWICLQWLREQW